MSAHMETISGPGLDGVVVANTVLSEVDGEQGRLVIRGYALEDLVGHLDFAALAAHLWQGLAARDDDAETVDLTLGEARVHAFDRLAPLLDIASRLGPVEGLRLGLAGLTAHEPLPSQYVLTGAIPVLLAGMLRRRQGLAAIAPDPTRGQAADFLRMLHHPNVPDPAKTAALDAYLVTVAEHGMNASTFTARVIASTRAGAPAAVVGALGALQGPLHGGAPGPVLDMLDAIRVVVERGEGPDPIAAWLAAQLAAGERLMGFGHRIYRVRDPRADVLKGVVERLGALGGPRLAFAQQVERAALTALAAHKPDRPLHTNVEFYTALLLDALDLPRDAFTAVFAMGRVLGWTAHVFEQERTGRLLRPQSRYVGPERINAM